MGLTRRKDSHYVEFPVVDDGKTLTLARGVQGAKLKRWKVGTKNRTLAKQQEALIKTALMKGEIKSERLPGLMTFRAWGEKYLEIPEIKNLASYRNHVEKVNRWLVPFFGDKRLTEITPDEVEAYRAQRRLKNGKPPTIATLNGDHAILKQMLYQAVKRGLLLANPASKVWRDLYGCPLPRPCRTCRDSCELLFEHQAVLQRLAGILSLQHVILLEL